MNRGCGRMIVLGHLCGDALFLFVLLVERSMPVSYIGASGLAGQSTNLIGGGSAARPTLGQKRTAPAAPKSQTRTMPDHTSLTRLPTTATLRQFARRGSRQKNAGPPPQPDHTCFTRLPTSTMSDSLGLGPAQENDPWRFRQQSSRVISIQFWYLTSWLPRFL